MTTPAADPRYTLTFTPVPPAEAVDPQPPDGEVELLELPSLRLLYDGVTYHYAYGPGYFTRIESPEDFDRGLEAGLWGERDTALTVDADTLAAIKDIALRGVPKAEAPAPVEGGARVGRGYVYLDEFGSKTATNAERMRLALTSTNQAIVPLPGTTIDVGSDPLLMTARRTIMGLGGPQNEFKSTWPIYIKGAKAGFRNAGNGTNYGGNKGWVLKDLCIVGQSGIPMIEPVAAANQLNYVGWDGCSFDTWNTIFDGPALGLWLGGGVYTNNIYGAFAYRFKGSDCQIWTDGGKLDFGMSQRNANATGVIFSWMEKSYVGPVYITGDPARPMLVEGANDREGVTFVGLTLEGRNAGAQTQGAALRVTGGGGSFIGCNFNFSRAGRDEQGIVHMSGGSASFLGCRWRRAANWGPEIYQAGGVLDVSGARAIYTDRAPGQIELRRAGGTLLASDGTVRLV